MQLLQHDLQLVHLACQVQGRLLAGRTRHGVRLKAPQGPGEGSRPIAGRNTEARTLWSLKFWGALSLLGS